MRRRISNQWSHRSSLRLHSHLQSLRALIRGQLEGQSRKSKKSRRTQRAQSPTLVSEWHPLPVGNPPNGSVAEMAVEDPIEDIRDDIVQSDSKNDAAGALIPTGTVGVGSVFRRRLHLMDRSCSIPIFTKIINKGIADFLNASDRSEFDTAVLRVRSQLRFHTHYSSCQSASQ